MATHVLDVRLVFSQTKCFIGATGLLDSRY